jgi:hypothetical protein
MPDETVIPRPLDGIDLMATGSEQEPLTYIPDIVPIVSREDAAQQAMSEKWTSLEGAPGEPKVADSSGLVAVGDGFFREYVYGRIYLPSITSVPVYVHGSVGDRYTQLDGPNSWLGWPTADEQAFTEDGRVSTFQNGAIYWWPDTGAIDVRDVSVQYTGLYCFGETDNDQVLSGSSADEPYVIFGVVPVLTNQASSRRTQIYEDVDAGDSREDNIELYRGLPYGLSLSAVLMEHDLADPNMYQELIKQCVDSAIEKSAVLLAEVPYVGPVLAVVAEPVLKSFAPDIAVALNDLIDGKDDHIGTVPLVLSAKDMVRLTRVEQQHQVAIAWRAESPLISGDGASYKVYFDIQPV